MFLLNLYTQFHFHFNIFLHLCLLLIKLSLPLPHISLYLLPKLLHPSQLVPTLDTLLSILLCTHALILSFTEPTLIPIRFLHHKPTVHLINQSLTQPLLPHTSAPASSVPLSTPLSSLAPLSTYLPLYSCPS